MKVYLAARFESRWRLRDVALELAVLGYQLVSSWLVEPTPLELSEEDKKQIAIRDLSELKAADLLILDTLDENIRGGREVEWGIALTRAIPRYIVGPARNVFHFLATRRFDSWNEAVQFFRRQRASGETSQ